MNEDEFKPDFTANINDRHNLFMEEMMFVANTVLKSKFKSRTDSFDEKRYKHQIWSDDILTDVEKTNAVFGVKQTYKLPKEDLIYLYQNVFLKHFPGQDGKLVSNLYTL